MRVEPYTIGSIVHIVKRGGHGMNIVRDDEDRWRFLKSLFLLNDEYGDKNWHRDTIRLPMFERPKHWPDRVPLTNVIGWTLMPNHLHLILQEVREGGTSKFIQRLCGSMSLCFNGKYGNSGSIFQGAYRSRLVEEDAYARYLMFYVMVKNVLELYPGGITAALDNFNSAWEWALKYPFSSLPIYAAGVKSPILDHTEIDIFKESISKSESFELLREYVSVETDKFADIALE